MKWQPVVVACEASLGGGRQRGEAPRPEETGRQVGRRGLAGARRGCLARLATPLPRLPDLYPCSWKN